MAAFSYDKHNSFRLDSSLMFLISDTTEQSVHDFDKPYFSSQDQADPTVEALSSANTSTDSTSITKIITGIRNSSSSAASAKYQQVTNSMEKRKNNFPQSHSKVKGKKPKNETSSDNVDEGSISLKTEGKLIKRRSRRSADNDKKKKKSCGAEARRDSAPSTGYVYVRARRGQATDSHSLAERVRREQIRERMELLQALVPGCDKIAGKAVMLDHVINYVQTLQNQIEFLSLKIASSDPMFNDYAYGMNSSAFVVEPAIQNERLISLEATNEPSVQQQNHIQATNDIFNTSDGYSFCGEQNHCQAANSIFKTYTTDDYSLIDTSTFIQQAAQMPTIMSQYQPQSHSGFANNVSFLHLP
ncbi:hypothetical protein ACET3Z_027441 [Daucus carota]